MRTHNNTRQSVLDGCKAQYQTIDAALLDTANQTMTDADRTTLVNHSAWLKVVEADVRYKDINHWKIPFPAEPLPYFELPD